LHLAEHGEALVTPDLGFVAGPNAALADAPLHHDQAPKDAQPFFQSTQAIAAPYIKAGKWHTFSGSEPIVEGMQLVPLPGRTPGHTGYELSSKGQTILFWGDIVRARRVQLQHPEVTVVLDIDPTARGVAISGRRWHFADQWAEK
jgi:glyoxylase-like metal-dependent hydrolase (beta-lactamase superfamily II)